MCHHFWEEASAWLNYFPLLLATHRRIGKVNAELQSPGFAIEPWSSGLSCGRYAIRKFWLILKY